MRIRLRELHIASQSGLTVANLGLARSLTRGTPNNSLIGSELDPGPTQAPSGAAVDAGIYTLAPTFVTNTKYSRRWVLPAAIGAGIVWVFQEPMEIPPGQGIIIVATAAIAVPISDITAVWDE